MYRFTERKTTDKLSNGKTRCYYNERMSEETITTFEDGNEVIDRYSVWDYDCVDLDEVSKGAITDAIVRVRYSQSAVEALVRHLLADADGAKEEFAEFNTYAEWAKVEAEKILAE